MTINAPNKNSNALKTRNAVVNEVFRCLCTYDADRGARVDSKSQCAPTPSRSLFLDPRQRVEIDVAAGENDADALSENINFVFDNAGVRNSC